MAIEIADELRRARIAAGLTQAQIAATLGVRRAEISTIERADLGRANVELLTRHAALVGLRFSVKLYPIGGALRDGAQLRYINAFLQRVGAAWQSAIEVPMPLPDDLRAIDVVLKGPCVIAVEVVTRLLDIQSIVRAAQLKQRDMGAARLIIVVSGTHANRRALAEARAVLATTFDLDTQRTMRLLAAGVDPGRDAIVVLA